MGDWESDRKYTTNSAPSYRVTHESPWPAAVAYVGTLVFIAFLVWMFFG